MRSIDLRRYIYFIVFAVLSAVMMCLTPMIVRFYASSPGTSFQKTIEINSKPFTSPWLDYKVNVLQWPEKNTATVKFGFPFKCFHGSKEFANPDPRENLMTRVPGYGRNFVVNTISIARLNWLIGTINCVLIAGVAFGLSCVVTSVLQQRKN
jgi:hypothetical protein